MHSFLDLTGRVLRHNPQPRMRRAFRTDRLFQFCLVKEDLLADLGSQSFAANGKRIGRAPV